MQARDLNIFLYVEHPFLRARNCTEMLAGTSLAKFLKLRAEDLPPWWMHPHRRRCNGAAVLAEVARGSGS